MTDTYTQTHRVSLHLPVAPSHFPCCTIHLLSIAAFKDSVAFVRSVVARATKANMWLWMLCQSNFILLFPNTYTYTNTHRGIIFIPSTTGWTGSKDHIKVINTVCAYSANSPTMTINHLTSQFKPIMRFTRTVAITGIDPDTEGHSVAFLQHFCFEPEFRKSKFTGNCKAVNWFKFIQTDNRWLKFIC